jgi:sterol 3beta-glucosyltransferase
VFAPLARVLPRFRVAVVSGALGTLGATLAAGVPVVVVPQLFDRVWHGGRVEELGVGVMAVRAQHVAAAVARVDADPQYRRRAQELATQMANEDGAGSLVDAVESAV